MRTWNENDDDDGGRRSSSLLRAARMSMIPVNNNKTSSSSLALDSSSTSSSSSFSNESQSSDDYDDSSVSSHNSGSSSSSFFSGSETKLGISQSDDSSEAQKEATTTSGLVPALQYNLNWDDDDDDDSSAYSTSSSSTSGSEQTNAMLRITKFDSSSLLGQILEPCHFAALSSLVTSACGGGGGEGSTMKTVMLHHENKQEPPQQQEQKQNHIIPESVQFDSHHMINPMLDKINNDKIEETSAPANNAETTTRVVPSLYMNNNGPLAIRARNNVLSISTKKSQQDITQTAITLLDCCGLNGASVPSKRQAPSPSISYNNKISIVGGSNGTVRALPISTASERPCSQDVPPTLIAPALIQTTPVSERGPRSQVPPPIGYGFTLVEEEQPQTLKGDILPPQTRFQENLPTISVTATQGLVSSTSLAGSTSSSQVGSSSPANSFSKSAVGPTLSSIAAASFFSYSETQLFISESDLVSSNSETDPEPAILSDLTTMTRMVNDTTLISGTEARNASPEGHLLEMVASDSSKDVAVLSPIPEIEASKTTHTTIGASAITVPVKQGTKESIIEAPKTTTPNTETVEPLIAAKVRTSARRTAKLKMAKLSTRKTTRPQDPVTTKATVPKMTKAKKHAKAALSKARIPATANRGTKTAVVPTEDSRPAPTTELATSTRRISTWILAKQPLADPLIPPALTIKKGEFKLQSRSPTVSLVAQE